MLRQTHAALPRVLALGMSGALVIGLLVAGPAGAGVRPGSGAPAVLSAPKSLVSLTPKLPASVIKAASAPNSHWRPGKPRYGSAAHNDLAVKGVGGTTIRVNEIYPTTRSGKPARGPFPVLLTMTPYGKGAGAGSGNNYLVQRGYINIVEDVRGTGDSGGKWGLFDPVQQHDAIRVVRWAARLPHSSGVVGTFGPSYLGIDQMLLAGTIGRHSPLKAIFPVVSANDIYRDTSYMGGLLDAEFNAFYLGLTGTTNTLNPLADGLSDQKVLAQLAQIEADHLGGIASYHAGFTAKTLAGSAADFDQKYWLERSPGQLVNRIVANRIPAFLVGGEFDIFQHGEPLNYAALQNAWAHRPVNAPMRPGQPTTGRYQLIDGPWEHVNGSAIDLNRLELEWFDTWLKHKKTGMARTPTPLHYYDLGTGKFLETTAYPFTRTSPTRFYLGRRGTLLRHKPATAGTTSIDWVPTGTPCGRPIDQWGAGLGSLTAHAFGALTPCADGDALSQLGPGVTTFTSQPFARARTVAGPIAATLYATATTRETQWVAELELVTRGGRSYPVTEGALLGSLRAVQSARSWRSHGTVVLPYHPYTKASARPVVPGKLTRYQIEIFPTLITIPKGDRLRLTISTSDVPHLTPLPAQVPKLLGGVYAIAHSRRAPSSLTVELRRR
jgi:putative CocE/NonD family hydrolase